ncbi:MAG: PaaI family thioesterase [Gemmatimonadota bacterium]
MKRLSESERAELTARWNEHPGMRHLGVQVDLSAPEEVRVYVDPVLPFHRGGMGTEAVNGAIISGVFDLAIGLVGHFHTPGKRSGTAQLHIHFLRPVLGDRFGVVARVVRAGRSLVFAEADLHDEEGRLCGRCDGIVAVVGDATAEPAGPVPL